MSALQTGRCLCGAVTYECGPPVIKPSFCHCESCRRAAGAHVVAWATVKRDSFRITAGSPRSFASSPPVFRVAHAPSPQDPPSPIPALYIISGLPPCFTDEFLDNTQLRAWSTREMTIASCAQELISEFGERSSMGPAQKR